MKMGLCHSLRLNLLWLFPLFFDFAHHFSQVFLGYSIYSYILIPSKHLNTHGLSISQKLINKQDKYQTNHDIACPVTALWWSFLFCCCCRCCCCFKSLQPHHLHFLNFGPLLNTSPFDFHLHCFSLIR